MADTFLEENIDELLALDPETEVLLTEDIDAEAILGEGDDSIDKGIEREQKRPNPVLDSQFLPKSKEVEISQETCATTTVNKLNGLDNPEEAEQLDYEEEEEEMEEKKQPRESKFVSERASSQKSDRETQDSPNNKRSDRKYGYHKNGQGNKYYINPNFKGNLPPTIKVNLTKGPYRPNPSMNSFNTAPPFPVTQLRPAFGVQQGMTGFSNSFQQNPVTFGSQQQPSSSFLPNPVAPVITLPTVHIRPIQQQQSSSFIPPLMGRPNGLGVGGQGAVNVPRALPHVTSEAVNWTLMVDAFVRKTNSEAKMRSGYRRREYSPKSSRSRSPASSYSGSSSYSTSRSPSPVQARKPRKVARYDQRDSRPFNTPNRRSERQHMPSRGRDQERETKPKPDKHSIECAQAIGLDEEYLKKIEQQKQAREEVARRKNQRRQENYAGKDSSSSSATAANNKSGGSRDTSSRNPPSGNSNKSNERRRGNSPSHNRTNRRRSPVRAVKSGREEEKRPKVTAEYTRKAESTESDVRGQPAGKLKAYLAVVVNNVSALENAFKQVSLLANGIGKTKKALEMEFQSSENNHFQHLLLPSRSVSSRSRSKNLEECVVDMEKARSLRALPENPELLRLLLVWQPSGNSVSIIFEKHEDAKAFMLQYHGKSVNGHRMDVTLEKVFLNLSAMP